MINQKLKIKFTVRNIHMNFSFIYVIKLFRIFHENLVFDFFKILFSLILEQAFWETAYWNPTILKVAVPLPPSHRKSIFQKNKKKKVLILMKSSLRKFCPSPLSSGEKKGKTIQGRVWHFEKVPFFFLAPKTSNPGGGYQDGGWHYLVQNINFFLGF